MLISSVLNELLIHTFLGVSFRFISLTAKTSLIFKLIIFLLSSLIVDKFIMSFQVALGQFHHNGSLGGIKHFLFKFEFLYINKIEF